jgi:hypothetical protein
MRDKLIILAIAVAGCTGFPGAGPRAGETVAVPQQAAHIARETFSRHGFNVRPSNMRLLVATDFFVAQNVWSTRELNAYVECSDPKKNPRPEMPITMQIRAEVRAYNSGESERVDMKERVNRPNSVVTIRGSGNRGDGGKCALTDSYAAALLEEIVVAGGKPIGGAQRAGR